MPPRPPFGDFGLHTLRSDRAAASLAPLDRLRRLAALERSDLIVIAVYAVAIGFVSLAVPIAAQSLVNTVAFMALLQPIVVLSALVFAGLLAAGALRALQYRVVDTLQQRFFVRTAHEAASRLTAADIESFTRKGGPELMTRFLDVAIVQKTASTLLLDGLAVILQGAVSLVLLAFYHPALLAFDVVLIALIVFTLVVLGRGGVATAIKESKAKYATAAWLHEVASAFRAFKGTESAAFAFARTDELARGYVTARRKHFHILLRQIVASYLLQAVGTAVLLGLGAALVMRGELTLGQLVAAELIVTSVLVGVAKMGKYLESYYDLVASIDKVGAIVDLEGEPDEGTALRAGHVHPAHLRLDDVSFAYGSEQAALRAISFDLPAGERLAILGTSGSGKSTLVDVLYGLRAPSGGVVELDGVDVRTLSLRSLRRNVALVGAPEIFDGTILDNVWFARAEVDAGVTADVLAAVGLTDEIARMSSGAMTTLGRGGSRLTSSQASRLMIARALVASPRLLVIDDALDSLSNESAVAVLRGIASIGLSTSLVVFTTRKEIAAAVGRVIQLDTGGLAADAGGEEREP